MFIQVKRQGLTQIVADDIRNAIIHDQLGVDDILPTESELAQTFNVSRSVIREAVKQLETLGLIETRQGRRSRIRPPDPTAAIDSLHLLLQRCQASPAHLLEVRRTLEVDIAGFAAERRTSEQMVAIAKSIEQQAAAASVQEKVRWDLCFHQQLAQATGNPLYSQMLATLIELLRDSLSRTIAFHGGKRSITGHRQIADALKHQSSSAARKAMYEHLVAAEQDHLKLFKASVKG